MMRPHLSLLGGFEYRGGTTTPPVLSRKARAMLAYLALQPGHSQSREKLATLLWGGATESQARMNLRQVLSVLRKSLRSASGPLLSTDGDSVTFRIDDVDCDVARFEQLASATAAEQLDEAMALYRGDLLDGFSIREESFEDWLRVERERLRAIAVSVLERLVAHHSETKRITSCVKAATRLLVLEPLREDVHRALMRTYAAQGRFNLALLQYERCRDELHRQLRIQPEPETRELYESLRARRTGSDPAAPMAPGLGGPASIGPAAADHALLRPTDGERVWRPTQYVKSAGCNIAYQVTGNGPPDVLYVPGWVSNLDHSWASPRLAHVLQRLGSFSRLIRMDKRGTGLSDRDVGLPTLEERMEDVRAVLDAVGSTRTVLFGSSEGGNMCMLFAATYPERTAALVLNGSYARGLWAPDYPWGRTRDQVEAELEKIDREWGEPADLANAAPSLVNDAFEREWFAAYLRNSASPHDAISLWRWSLDVDVRDILSAIHVPTLILHSTGDRWVMVEEGRYLAGCIAGARYVELPGDDHVIWGCNSDRLVDEIQAFVTGALPLPASNYALVTVLVAELFGSAPTGLVRDELSRADGSEVQRTGNGFTAIFQGPTGAIDCAMAIRRRLGREGLGVRAAVHIGECEKHGNHFTGPAIHLTARLLDYARTGDVIVSRTVRDLVFGSGLVFEGRGEFNVGAASGPLSLYSVRNQPVPDLPR